MSGGGVLIELLPYGNYVFLICFFFLFSLMLTTLLKKKKEKILKREEEMNVESKTESITN